MKQTFDIKQASRIEIDTADWAEATTRDEQIISAPEDLHAQIVAGVPLARIARNAVVSRAGGAAPEDLLAPNKTLLHIGAVKDVNQRFIRTALIAMKKAPYKKRPRFIGKNTGTGSEDGEFQMAIAVDDAPGYADTENKASRAVAMERARVYLLEVVPGHIWNHLAVIADLGGDIKPIVSELKAKIDAQAAELLGKPHHE